MIRFSLREIADPTVPGSAPASDCTGIEPEGDRVGAEDHVFTRELASCHVADLD
jgi:hypothetical protein